MTPDAIAAEFHSVAQQVYHDDPLWLGEDLKSLTEQFRAALSQSDLKLWTKCLPGIARLAVSISPRQVIDGRLSAFFGFWEGTDSPDQQSALFREAEQWAKDQGAECLIGPINLSTFYSYRVRLNEFAAGAFPGEPYNPPYYAGLLDTAGFRPLKQFHSWLGPIDDRVEALSADMEPALQGLESEGLSFLPLNGDTWLGRLDEFYDYVDQIFGNNFAYTRISRDHFETSFGSPIARRLCPHSSVLAQNADGEIAGFFLGFPDYGPLVQQGNKEQMVLSEIGFEDFSRLKGRRTLLGKTGGVHPDFRNRGLFGIMSYLMLKRGSAHYDWGGAVLVREDNPSARVAELMFSRPQDQRRDYGLFAKDL